MIFPPVFVLPVVQSCKLPLQLLCVVTGCSGWELAGVRSAVTATVGFTPGRCFSVRSPRWWLYTYIKHNIDHFNHFIFLEVFCFSGPQRAACGILVSQPGIEPGPLAVKAQSPNHWTAREFPKLSNYEHMDLLLYKKIFKPINILIFSKCLKNFFPENFCLLVISQIKF